MLVSGRHARVMLAEISTLNPRDQLQASPQTELLTRQHFNIFVLLLKSLDRAE